MAARIRGACSRSGISIVALLFAVLAAAASAASPPTATRLVSRPASLTAGTPWTATVAIRRAGKPLLGAQVALTARLRSQLWSAPACPAGPGLYRARLVLPAAGRWLLTARVGTRTFKLGAVSVQPRFRLGEPYSISLAPDGAIVVANGRAHDVLRVSLDGTLTRVAGNGRDGSSGDGGPATSATVGFPISVAVAEDGDVYVVSAHRVRRVDTATGLISTVAGTGEDGHTGDGGPATRARLQGPTAVAVDAHEDLYITEYGGYVRRVDAATGVITTIAGVGRDESSGDGGPATQAAIDRPHGVAIGLNGDVYVSDSYAARLRRIDRATGIISTVLGPDVLDVPIAVAVGPDGSVYVGEHGPTDRVWRLFPDGRVANPVPVAVDDPAGLDLDRAGNLFISEVTIARILRVDAATGRVTTIARR